MFTHKILTTAGGLAVLGLFGLFAGDSVAEDASAADYSAMTPQELADHLIIEKAGFRLNEKAQEGGTTQDRLTQDGIQKACSALGKRSIDSTTASKVTSIARESIKLPEGGIKLGDWSKGEAVARSGYGFRIGHRNDNHSKRNPGGNCYACHALAPDEFTYGTLGPSLTGYGKQRGNSDAILKYTYEVIYNAHTYFPCTAMPRFGHNGVLTQQQISDVMAYLLDPKSPVNK
ncbi:sulfur oxidation c-type cytochrome SoxX [Sulfuriflexus mobilis]|uniref:sulfur oxidation c-type cytochrome SoxX n=1 Tax=Sulfuriflexus mobilis TaxID=1811807 RepID=UPI000F81D77E|nr:sulfur oxidation c-type cytochrome SoxX [Sulfuriflexus mobilis]